MFSPSRALTASFVCALSLLPRLLSAAQEIAPPPSAPAELPELVVTGRSENLIGIAATSNEGTVGAEQLAQRPLLRPGEVVETIPGVIVTQHSGGGKANQFFLRGFNLDHGTDLATSLDGMPINMRSHAHGQGYTDLNLLIPELIERVDYRKGPYFAEVGDFGSAGAFDIRLVDELDRGILSLGGGTLGYARALLADSFKLGAGRLLYGLELQRVDGPWEQPDDFQHLNALVRYSQGDDSAGWSITGMAYKGQWNATDQVPDRALADGFPRFGSLDRTTGGDSQRYSLLAEVHRATEATETKANFYASYYDLDLFSNFTYFLDDPVRGDQFEQHDRRVMLGGAVSHQWNHQLWGKEMATKIGLQTRFDNIRNGLWHTEEQRRLETTRYDHILETSVGLFAENRTQWAEWFRTVVGVRGDAFFFDVDNGTGGDSGSESDFLASPKVSLVFGPWAKTEFYVNGGLGYHSNDARGVTSRTDPADPLVRTKGAEVGVRTTIVEGLQSSLTLWMLDIDSELLFVGDAGTTEASRPSRRYGVEWANYYRPTPWLDLDADVAFSQARFRDTAPEGQRIPGSIEAVISAGLSVHDLPVSGPLSKVFASLRARYFGPRDLIEDGSARSENSFLLYLQAGYKLSETWTATVDIFNLLDAEVNDIEYFYTSRTRGERVEGYDDFHVHPVEPRSVRFTLSARF